MSTENQEKVTDESSTFACPQCLESLNKDYVCSSCAFIAEKIERIPILVKDHKKVQKQIEEAKLQGRTDWYEQPQDPVLHGPYRHHVKKRRDYVESAIKRFVKRCPVSKALDLGCGDGINLSWLRKYANTLLGSDYNMQRLLRAESRKITSELALADITEYSATDETFDLIFFNHVLEHIPHDTKALSEVYRILKKGGICVLGVPNEGAFFWRLAYKLQPHTLETTDHVHFYTAKTLKRKLLEVGFHVREIKSLGWGLPHWGLDARFRGYKFLDDLFEFFGKIFLPNQASSLYFIVEK